MKKIHENSINKIILVAFFSCLILLITSSCENATSQENQVREEVSQTIEDTIPVPIKMQLRPPYDSSRWTHILDIDATITEDLRYATTNNFVEAQMYDCPACYLRPEAAIAVGKAHKILQEKGYGGLKMFDCYRPRPIQQKLWDKVPNASYVTPPWKGSMHNKGLAVDLTILDSNGVQLDMGTHFDFFGKEGHHTYTGHSPEILANRKLLKETMYAVGFRHIRTEWWHYSYTKVTYPISDWVWKCID